MIDELRIDSDLGITIEYLPLNERNHLADIFRLCYPGSSQCWVATYEDVAAFWGDLDQLLIEVAVKGGL